MIVKRLFLFLAFILFGLVIYLYTTKVSFEYDPFFLMAIITTIFCGVIPITVALFAAREFLLSNRLSYLLISCAIFVFSAGTCQATYMLFTSASLNAASTIQNSCTLYAAFLQLAAALWNDKSDKNFPSRSSKNILCVFFFVSIAFIILVSILAVNNILWPFMDAGGATPVREIILIVSTALYFTASMLFFKRYQENRTNDQYWYFLSLFMHAISLFAFICQRSMGDPIAWIGRICMYIGGILAGASILSEISESGVQNRSRILSTLFSDTQTIYKSIVESTLDAIISTDQNLRIVYMNPEARKLFGTGMNVITSFEEYIAFESDQILLKSNMDAFIHSKPNMMDSAVEITAKDKYGRVFPTEMTISMYLIPAGCVATHIIRDITVRKELEKVLQKNEARFRSVLNNSLDVIFCFNVQKRQFEYLSPSVETVTGYAPDYFMAMNSEEVLAMIDPESLPEIFKALAQLNEKGTTEAIYRQRAKSGEYRWISNHISLFRDSSGNPLCYNGNIRDITEHKIMEGAVKKSEREALALVRKLEEEDRNKDLFISVLSHEVRNPLAAISAGVQVLEVAQNSGQAKKAREIIKRQTNQLCKLVEDLLDLTRITENKIRLNKENVNLTEIVKCTAEDFSHQYEEKGVKLEIEMQARPIIINADAVRITQAVGNLLMNALKYTQINGLVLMTLKAEESTAVITIKDNGIGFDAELRQRIFTPFIQADISLDRHGGGLGLGLSIVKGIVDLHQGSVDAYSDGLGKGATFIMRLPIAIADSSVIMGRTLLNYTNNVKIEDNRDFADLFGTMLASIDCNVHIAYDGIDGIKQAKQIKPAIVFCDIGLPGMDGFEVANIMKADEALKHIPLVALTGYTRSKEYVRESGFDMHIAKPVDLDVLKQVLSEL